MQHSGEPWICVWCKAANSGYTRRSDPASATIADLAADMASHGLEFTGRPKPGETDTQPVLIATTDEIPGYQITRVHGDVFGLIVLARHFFSNLGAQFQTIAGGEVAGDTRLLADSRNEARMRMWREARARGANAFVGMRFDCSEIGGIMCEMVAHGTAVTAEPIADTASVAASDTGHLSNAGDNSSHLAADLGHSEGLEPPTF